MMGQTNMAKKAAYKASSLKRYKISDKKTKQMI